MSVIPFNDPRFTHLSITPQPSTPPKFSKDGKTLTIHTEVGKDFWRTTERHSYDAPVIAVDAPNGDWEVSVGMNLKAEIQVGLGGGSCARARGSGLIV
jgi:hypothetical protein